MTTNKAQIFFLLLMIVLAYIGYITKTPMSLWDLIQTAALMVIVVVLSDMNERQIK